MMDVPVTKYARNGDVHIAYQVFGEGDLTVVGAPPIVSNIEVIWEDRQARQFLERMASFCRVIHFDKRGQGMSDRDTGVPTLDDRIDDLRAVMDAEDVEQAALAGISEGGSTVALFAATYPERVSRLVLFATFARALSAPDYPFAPDDDAWEWFTGEWADHWGTPETLSVNAIAPCMVGDEAFARWANRYERQATSPGGLRQALAWIKEIDIRPVLSSIQAPTLVMHRKGDKLIFVDHGRYLGKAIAGARYLELDGAEHVPWWGDQAVVLDAVEEFLTGARASAADLDRVLSTVVLTDIVGSTSRATELGDRAWKALLDDHDAAVAQEVDAHRGRVVKSTGDGALAMFDGPSRAVGCTLRLRDRLRAQGIEIRAGVHTGEIELRGSDVGGIAVHIAARVEGAAGPGEVLVSRTVKDLVAGSGFAFEDRGLHALKGVEDEWQLYCASAAP
jgi:class 3 adenylate cyclase/pimeloyl-ACP methyl ester carboxylesterase